MCLLQIKSKNFNNKILNYPIIIDFHNFNNDGLKFLMFK